MQEYKIKFDALNIHGEVLKTLTLQIKLPVTEYKNKKLRALQRLCVEYARLNDVSCSYSHIISMETV